MGLLYFHFTFSKHSYVFFAYLFLGVSRLFASDNICAMMSRSIKRLLEVMLMLIVIGPYSEAGGHHRPRVIAQCSWDGNTFSLYDAPQVTSIGVYDSITIDAQMLDSNAGGAIFIIKRSGNVIFRKEVSDMENPNGWLGVSDDLHSFAINTSNAGAAGGWSIAILRLREDGTIADLSNSVQAVEKDFSARHSCETRGNNYEAIQWRSKDQLLISASVYPTSDCGKEMGYTEGYVLDVTTGKIITRMSEREMLNLPYICAYNVWQPGDPRQ